MFTTEEQYKWQLATDEQFKRWDAQNCNSLDDMIPLGQMHIRSFAPLKEELTVYKNMGISTDKWNNDTQLLKIKNLFPKADKPDQIYYQNEWNHRDNWTYKKKIVGVFGCSATYGVGVDKNFCNYLQEWLPEVSVWNFGTQAYNLIHMARKYAGISNIVDFDTIIMMLPNLRLVSLRDGLFKDLTIRSQLDPFGPEFMGMISYLDRQYYDDLLAADDLHIGAIIAKFADYIVDTAHKKGTKVIIGAWQGEAHYIMKQTYPELTLDKRWQSDRAAYDGVHPSTKSHEEIATVLFERMALK